MKFEPELPPSRTRPSERLEQLPESVPILGKSAKIRNVMERAERVAQSDSSVLLLGESGTGKEVVARTIHARSLRCRGPFVPVNCSALPEHLLESEFFGHKKGAFTGADENRRGLFEEADGGTLFLDEIGDMPIFLQAKLLRVLQDKKVRPVGENVLRSVNVRIIAATHKNLIQAIQSSKFREDLYYRLAVVTISIPPLRERREDIPEITHSFLVKYFKTHGLSPRPLRPRALEKLIQLPWVGNVRELENTLERALVLSRGPWIEESDIEIPDALQPASDPSWPVSLFASLPTLQNLEKAYIEYVLDQTGQTKERAAQVLGVDRKTLYRKVLEFGIRDDKSKGGVEN